MKKLMLIVCCCSLLPVCAHAGGPLRPMALLRKVNRSVTRHFTSVSPKLPRPKAAAGVLERRAITAERNAFQAQQQLTQQGLHTPKDILRGPTQHVYFDKKGFKSLQQTYPSLPYVQGRGKVVEQNVENMVSARNNRLYTRLANSVLDRYPRIQEIMEQVHVQTGPIGKPENPTQWLAKQIPNDTHVLLVGEGFYNNPGTVDAIADFLPHLRQEMPEREIIILTTDLDKGIRWTPQLDTAGLESYNKKREIIWKNAYDNDMQVIGSHNSKLENYDASLAGLNDEGVPAFRFWATSFEALDIQAKEIMQDLADVQAKHPNALIVLHVEQAQSSYTLPFSLANKLKATEQNLFVADITSKTSVRHDGFFFEDAEKNGGVSPRTLPFEQMYPEASLPDAGVVSRELAEDVGSDAWIKIPYDKAKQDTGRH